MSPNVPTLEAGPSQRRSRRRLAGAALAVGLATSLALPAWARPAPDSFADLAAAVSPVVVNISVEIERPAVAGGGDPRDPFRQFGPDSPFRDFLERFFGDQMPPLGPHQGGPGLGQRALSAGSGFIVDAEGYVVTNNHVVEQGGEITVILSDGDSYEATLVGGDERSDLALLKIEAERALPTVEFGDSDAVRPGDWVLAVGNPFGLGGTVTAGIVSARGRALPGGALIDYMQIDAPINRGNSGGPSFNAEGDVVGVNTAIFSPNGGSVGIGFAIPSNLAESVIAQLRESGFVERGWLGVQIQQVTPDIAEGLGLEAPRGALIASLVEGGPAEGAGFRSGDVVLDWDGQAVEKMRDLPRLVAATKPGKTVAVEVWRGREPETLRVTTGSLPEQRKQAAAPSTGAQPGGATVLPGTGLSVVALDERERSRPDLAEGTDGLLVVAVEPDSAAAAQDIRRGDVIVSIALQDLRSPDEALGALESLRRDDKPVATLMIARDGDTRFVALRLAQV